MLILLGNVSYVFASLLRTALDYCVCACVCCSDEPKTDTDMYFIMRSDKKSDFQWKGDDGTATHAYLCETFPLTASPTSYPSATPTVQPTTATPTALPTVAPTLSPTRSGDTNAPSSAPTAAPTVTPSISLNPTSAPSTFAPTTLDCPPTYTGFVKNCYRYVSTTASRASALAACRADEGGWLATLDESWKLDLVSYLGINDDTYFGLYKTSPCTLLGCIGKYAWDIRPGSVAPVGNYTLDMKRYERAYTARQCQLCFCILIADCS